MSAHHNLLIGGDTRDTRDTTSRDTATLGLGTLQGGIEGTARDAGDWVFAANKHEGEVPRVSTEQAVHITLYAHPGTLTVNCYKDTRQAWRDCLQCIPGGRLWYAYLKHYIILY